MKRGFFNWSGGKDSAFCLHHVLSEGKIDIKCLLTTLSETYRRISMHGVREELLDQQAAAIGLPLEKVWLPENASMESYNQRMGDAFRSIRQHDVEYAVFGDIFLEDLRQYREDKLEEVGLKALFNIWQIDTKELIEQFVSQGFKAVLVCVDERYLDRSFVGREIDSSFLDELPPNVDPCGENGEYHSFVYDGPLFDHPVNFEFGEVVYRQYDDPTTNGKQKTGFWYQDLMPV